MKKSLVLLLSLVMIGSLAYAATQKQEKAQLKAITKKEKEILFGQHLKS